MKVCTVLSFPDGRPPDGSTIEAGSFELIGSSLVDDDHEFGWHDEELHIEGELVAPRSAP